MENSTYMNNEMEYVLQRYDQVGVLYWCALSAICSVESLSGMGVHACMLLHAYKCVLHHKMTVTIIAWEDCAR